MKLAFFKYTGCLLVVFISILPIFAQSKNAETEAAGDFEKGRYIFKSYGLPSLKLFSWPSADEIYGSILKTKYEIAFEWVGGCLVDEETALYADTYNEALLTRLEAKYGKGILKEARDEANNEYERLYGEKERELNRKLREGLKMLSKKPAI